MKYDHDGGRYQADWEEDLEPNRPSRRPAPGKRTLTDSIPVQRRARPDVRPAQKAPDIAPFGFVQAYGGDIKEPASEAFPDEAPVSWLSAQADEASHAAFNFDYKPVRRAAAPADVDNDAVHTAAARGFEAPNKPLPHLDQIQKSFGHHNVSHVAAHVGGAAAEASAAMGAEAYAAGDHVAFASAPDLHTAAHEAAHIVQQQGGVQLKGGVGEAGDTYERHADAVADKVVAGESAEALLDEMAGQSRGGSNAVAAVQHKKRGGQRGERKTAGSSAVDVDEAFATALDALERGVQARDYFAANEAMREALELVPRVDELVHTGPARSPDEQAATERMRVQRRRFDELAPHAPSGGASSEDERATWVARTPVSLVRPPEQSRPRPIGAPAAEPIPPSREKAPITDVPVRPDDKAEREQEEYLGRHWDQLRESARQYFVARSWHLGGTRFRWAPGVDADKRAATTVAAIFPTLHIAGQLERLVAPKMLGEELDLGAHLKVRDGESDGDASWNPTVGTAVARLLAERLDESMTYMGAQYVAAYDRHGGHVEPAHLTWHDAMDRVASALLTQDFLRVTGPVPREERPHGARKPRQWRWLGKQDEALWNWIEVTDPRDASAEDVVLLLPPDVPPLVQHDGGLFRMPEDWARTQPGASEFAPPSSNVPTGTELAGSRFAPRAAIAEVKDQPRVHWTRERFDHAVEEIRGDLYELGGILGEQYAERVAAATVMVGAAEVADKALRADLANVFARQEPLLREILDETRTFHAMSLARGWSRGRGPVEAVYLELALAAGNSHLYDAGRQHLKAARATAADVDRQLAKEALTSASAGAASLLDAGGAGAEDARDRQRNRFDALDTNAADPGAIHVDISIDAFVLHTQTLETQLAAMMDALFATRDRLGPQFGSVFAMGLITAAEDLGSAVGVVRDQAAAVRQWLLERVESSSSPSARQEFLERAQKALGQRITATQIVTLSRRVASMLERVDDADRALQIVHATVVMLEISIVAAGVGMVVEAAATTPAVAAARAAGVMTVGRVGAATAGIVAETATSTLLQVGLLQDDPTKALGENLLTTGLSILALRGYHAVTERFGPFTAENIRLWEQLGGANAAAVKTMNVTLEMALGAGSGHLASVFMRGPVQPTEDEGLQLAMQGASIVASHWIVRRMHDSRTHLQEARARLPADAAHRIDATIKSIDALRAHAQEIAVTPVDAPAIREMFAEHHRIIGVEAALVGTHDGADGGPKARDHDGDKTFSATERDSGYVETVLKLAGLHQIRPGQWQGDEAVVRRLIAKKRTLPIVEERAANGDTQWSVTAGGTKHTIKVGNEEVPTKTSPDRKPFSEEGRRENAAALTKGEPGYNAVVGYVDKDTTGVAIMQRLMRGDKSALAEIGYEANGDFDPSTREWGLGRFGRNKYVIVAGEHSAVDWSAVSGVTPVGHSHPRDAERIRVQEGKRLNVREMVAAADDDDTRLAFCSPSDISLLVRRKVKERHTLALPYEHLGGAEITLASATPSGRSPIELVLENAMEIEPGPDGATRYRARATMKAGEDTIWDGTIDSVYPANGTPRLEFNSSLPSTERHSDSPIGAKTKSGRPVGDDDIDPLTNLLGDGPETDGVQIVDPLGKEPHQRRLPVAKDIDPQVPPELANSGHWADEHAKGNTDWFSDNQKVNEITHYNPIRFTDGYPILDPYTWETVHLKQQGGDADFSPADIELARRHGQFKRNGEPNQQWAKDFRKANKLTWHHHQDRVRMQLVPFDLHSNIPHAGGTSASGEESP